MNASSVIDFLFKLMMMPLQMGEYTQQRVDQNYQEAQKWKLKMEQRKAMRIQEDILKQIKEQNRLLAARKR